MIGAAGTPERSHFWIHSPSAGKSAQLDEACSKWSLTPSIDVQGKVAGLLGISLDDGTNS